MEILKLIKKNQGFSSWVYGHNPYYIGYGTPANQDEFPNGITQTEADDLLKYHLIFHVIPNCILASGNVSEENWVSLDVGS